MMTSRLSRLRLAALLALTAAVYAIELTAVPTLAARMPSARLAAAIAFDLAVVVPFMWWLFALRGSPRRIVPVVVASLAGAALVVPQDARWVVSIARFAILPFELLALFVAVRTVASALGLARSGADIAERLDDAMTKALGDNAVARMLAAESAAIVYALFGGRAVARPGVFTSRAAQSPAFTWGLTIATVVESGVLHLLLGSAHRTAAWILTGLGAYAVLWLVGQHRAIAARAVEVTREGLVLRAGLRLTARVPWSVIERVDAVSWTATPPRAPGYLDAARPIEPNVVIRFREPVEVTALLGRRRRVERVGICVDDANGLIAAVAADAELRVT